MSPIEKVIAEADILYTDNNIVDLYSLLKSHREAPVAEVQWRLGRAAYEMSKLTNKPEEKKAFIYEASDSVQKALELDDNSFAAHKVKIELILYMTHTLLSLLILHSGLMP